MDWCFRKLTQRLCSLCDVFLSGIICLGGISTVTTTSLQYTGYINNWRVIAASSIITFIAIFGCILRSVHKTQSNLSVNQHTIIINNTPPLRILDLEDEDTDVAIPA